MLQSFGITEKQVDAKVLQIVGAGGEPTGPPMPPGAHAPFAPHGKRVIDLSQSEAISLGHEHIDAEHILLALLRERDGVAARILADCGADYDRLRNEVLRRLSAHRARGALPDIAGAAFAESIRVDTPPPLRRLLMVAAARAALQRRRISEEPPGASATA